MGLDGCGKCMKYTMIVANVLIGVAGLVVMSVGIWTCVDKSSFEKLMGNDLFMSAAYILIATGFIVMIISVVGCLGAMRDVKCLLLTYFIILFMIFVIMLVGGILAYVFKNEVGDKMKARMKDTIVSKYMEPGVEDTWDTIQKELKCCGTSLDNKTDNIKAWQSNSKFHGNDGGPKVPLSCCIAIHGKYLDEKKCLASLDESPPIGIYTLDCFNATVEIVEKHALILGGVGVGIACVLILGMIFSMILFKTIE